MTKNSSAVLQSRMLELSVATIKAVWRLPNDFTGKHLGSQLVRSVTSVCMNYAEALGSESRKDFVHKLQISLKEAREAHVTIQIIMRSFNLSDPEWDSISDECNQLVAILTSSVKTLKSQINNSKSQIHNP